MSTANVSIPLGDLSAGQTARLECFTAGRGLINRLAVLGFLPGQEITMVQNFGRGPIIVTVRDTRVALGRHEAEQIKVRKV